MSRDLKPSSCEPFSTYAHTPSSGSRQRRLDLTQPARFRIEVGEKCGLGPLLKKGAQGKYAERYAEGTNLVLLAPEVAKAFPTADAVNEALRLVIQLKNIPKT